MAYNSTLMGIDGQLMFSVIIECYCMRLLEEEDDLPYMFINIYLMINVTGDMETETF